MKERTPLSEVKNFGPVCLAEFDSIGWKYLDQIERLGFEDTCRKWIQYFPERLNANAFLGIVCALDGIVWTKATPAHRRAAHGLARQLREEFGVKQPKRSNRSQIKK